MVPTAANTCCLISGSTIAAFFLGLILGYNNISIFSSDTEPASTTSPTLGSPCTYHFISGGDCTFGEKYCDLDKDSWSGHCKRCDLGPASDCAYCEYDQKSEFMFSCYGSYSYSVNGVKYECTHDGVNYNCIEA